MALAKYYEDILERQLVNLENYSKDLNNNRVDYDNAVKIKEKINKDIILLRGLIENCLDILTDPNNFKNLKDNDDIFDDGLSSNSRIRDLKKISKLRHENDKLRKVIVQINKNFEEEHRNLISEKHNLSIKINNINKNIIKRDRYIKNLKLEVEALQYNLNKIEKEKEKEKLKIKLKSSTDSRKINKDNVDKSIYKKYNLNNKSRKLRKKKVKNNKSNREKLKNNIGTDKGSSEKQYRKYLKKYKKH